MTNADDLAAAVLSPDSYERVRAVYLPAMIALRQRRRVRLGANIVVLFENRETVVAQLHEQLRAGGPWSPRRVRREAGELAPLLPPPGALSATLMIDGGPVTEGRRLCARIRAGAPVVALEIDRRPVHGRPVDDDADPACPIHYLRFALGAGAASQVILASTLAIALHDDAHPARAALDRETRRELANDLIPGTAPTLLATLAQASVARAHAPDHPPPPLTHV